MNSSPKGNGWSDDWFDFACFKMLCAIFVVLFVVGLIKYSEQKETTKKSVCKNCSKNSFSIRKVPVSQIGRFWIIEKDK
jgi:hypothetical protein